MKAASFEAIVRALNDAGVRYLVVGGLAVNAHGYGRATYDVDVVIGLDAANLHAAFTALAAIDYHPAVPITAAQFADPALRESWRAEKGVLVLRFWSDQHRETRLDVFNHEPFPFAEELRLARHREWSPGLTVPFVRLDTLLEMKRVAGRARDLADIDELNLLHGRRSSYDEERPGRGGH